MTEARSLIIDDGAAVSDAAAEDREKERTQSLFRWERKALQPQ